MVRWLWLFLLAPATGPGRPGTQAQGRVTVIVIANSANETGDLTFDTLRKIFLMEKTFWKAAKPIRLFAQESGKNRARDLVLEKVYRMDEKKYRKYWQLRVFKGEVSSAPPEKSEDQVAKDVAEDESALAYVTPEGFEKLPAEVRGKLKALTIDGRSHTHGEYGLVLP